MADRNVCPTIMAKEEKQEKQKQQKPQSARPSDAEIAAKKAAKKAAKAQQAEDQGGADEAPAAPAPPARLIEHYKTKVVPALQQKFGYTNALAVPRLDKIVISMGLGK